MANRVQQLLKKNVLTCFCFNKFKVAVSYRVRERKVQRSKPGKPVDVRVDADPQSFCNILTVDKSVLLLKSGNDITPSQVELYQQSE